VYRRIRFHIKLTTVICRKWFGEQHLLEDNLVLTCRQGMELVMALARWGSSGYMQDWNSVSTSPVPNHDYIFSLTTVPLTTCVSFSKVYGTFTWTESGDSNVVPLFAHLLAPSLQQPGHGVLCRGVEPGQENMLLIRLKLWQCLYLYVGRNVVFLFTRTVLVHAYRYY
jgi:hypothetical protein